MMNLDFDQLSNIVIAGYSIFALLFVVMLASALLNAVIIAIVALSLIFVLAVAAFGTCAFFAVRSILRKQRNTAKK